MATAAQRTRQINAARKRIDIATTKRDKAKADLAEYEQVLATQAKRIKWLESMPVDDEDNTAPVVSADDTEGDDTEPAEDDTDAEDEDEDEAL